MLKVIEILIIVFLLLAIKAVFVLGFDAPVVALMDLAKETKTVEIILWIIFAIGISNWPIVESGYRNSFSKGQSTRMVTQPDGTLAEIAQSYFSCTNNYERTKKIRRITLIQIWGSAIGAIIAGMI